jgi:hypothetical protein
MEVRDHCNRMVVRSNAELISIFMDLEKCTDRSHADNPCYYVFWEKKYVVADRMLFYKSWEWLMPVVRRINDLHTASVQDRSWNTRVKEVRESVVYVEIEVAYKAVIEFIKWYNAQPKCSSAIN